MNLGLAGKVAVVTGASKGIGLAVTRSLAAEGARVVAGARGSSPELEVLADQADVTPVAVDLTTPDGPALLVDTAVDRWGGIDVVVNNVGALRPRLDGFVAITDDEWEWGMSVNFFSAVRTMRAALPHLVGRPGACIVTVSSVNAFLPDPTVIDYGAAKAALTNLCKALAEEYGGRVRINTISPGPVQTDLWLGEAGVASTVARAKGISAEAVAGHAADGAATGRFTRPQEIADLVLVLVSDRADNITGSDFRIDGGLVKTL